jgi:hypothetical protein
MRNVTSVAVPMIVPPSSMAMKRSVAGDDTMSPSSAVVGGAAERESWPTSRATASTMAGVSVVAISTFTGATLVVLRRSDVRGSSSQIRRWQGRRTKA